MVKTKDNCVCLSSTMSRILLLLFFFVIFFALDVYVFQGFDVTFSFVSLLQKEGTGFLKNLSTNKFHGIGSNFEFSQFPADSGFENKFVYILKYSEYQLLKAN